MSKFNDAPGQSGSNGALVETPSKGVDYKSMSFDQLLSNTRANRILEERALLFIKKSSRGWLREQGFTGEIDPEGFLKQRSGVPSRTKPSDHLSAHDKLKVAELTKVELEKRRQIILKKMETDKITGRVR